MSATSRIALQWSPRLLGILTALFLGVFALDAFEPGRGFWASLPAFLVHLVPSYVLLATVALAWRRPWIGALVFVVLAALYAAWARRLDWILVIGTPLVLVAALFLLSWRLRPPPAAR